jgi:hypothetical protein
MLSVMYAECRKYAFYALCHYAKCSYADCRYAECHDPCLAVKSFYNFDTKSMYYKTLPIRNAL